MKFDQIKFEKFSIYKIYYYISDSYGIGANSLLTQLVFHKNGALFNKQYQIS